jgi:methylase of polypeptide subunit release factors
MSVKKEYGDFQTPRALARCVAALLCEDKPHFCAVIEPTCGVGALLEAAAERFGRSPEYWGFDVNPSYVNETRTALARIGALKATIEERDFYANNWKQFLSDQTEPILVIGNPPWITNAGMSVINGNNLPEKNNAQGHNGLDAMTGKANFDISEWMLIRLIEALDGHDATLAMLIKTVVARKVLRHAWTQRIRVVESQIFHIDAMANFGAAVGASLLVMKFGRLAGPPRAAVYGQLSKAIPQIATLGFANGDLVPDLAAFEATKHLAGTGPVKWRSGVKHDCASVMELDREGGRYRNRLEESVEIEPDYVFPMLKTSEVANGKSRQCTRYMLVPQRRLSDDTAELERRAPQTWRYLCAHRETFARRGSSIYRGKPSFSVFGVGDYTFAPWKIAISGMYKSLRFLKVGPRDGKPVVFDDVTNFLPCPSEDAADLVMELLNAPSAHMFFRGRVFWDAKRPITVELLNRLNLTELAKEAGRSEQFSTYFPPSLQDRKRKRQHERVPHEAPMLW